MLFADSGEWRLDSYWKSYAELSLQHSWDRLFSCVPLGWGQCHCQGSASLVSSSPADQLTASNHHCRIEVDPFGWNGGVLWSKAAGWHLPFCAVNFALNQWMTDCVVEFHLEVLGLMKLIQGALGLLNPRAVSQVDSVSVDVTDVVGFSVVSYLNYFAEAVDS